MNIILDWAGTLAADQGLSLGDSATQFALLPGVREGLACLVCNHKLFLVSSINQSLLEESMDLLDVKKYFQGVYGSVADKISALAILIKDLGLSQDETVAIGDMPIDVMAAKAAGVQSLAVTYGYTKAPGMYASEPDMLIHSFPELLRYLNKMAFVESRHFPVATVGGLIFDDQGKALLVRTRKWSDLYGIPGGKIEYGESMHTAFVREIKEETGLDIEDVQFVMIQDCIEHPEFYRPRHFLLVNYTAKVIGTQPRVKLNYESEAYLWAAPREAIGLALNGPTRSLLEKILESEAN